MAEPKLTPRESVSASFSAWLFQVYRKPLQFLFIILVVPLAVIVIATHQASVSMARRQALQNLRMTAKVAAEAMQATLTDAVLFAQLVSQNPGFVDALARNDVHAINADIEQALPLLPDAGEVIVTNAQGTVLTAFPDQAALIGKDLSTEGAYRGAQKGGWHPYVSSVKVRDEASLEKIVHVAVPVSREGRHLGLLIIEYRIESVRLWVQRVRVEPEGFIYAVDQDKQLVVYPFQILPGKPKVVSDWQPVAQPLLPDGFSMPFRDQRANRQWLAGVSPIGDTGWRVVAVQPDDAVLRVLYRIFLPMSVLVVILLGLVLFVSMRWAALQALNFRLLQQNAKLLKQSQQRWTLEQGKSPKDRQGGIST